MNNEILHFVQNDSHIEHFLGEQENKPGDGAVPH